METVDILGNDSSNTKGHLGILTIDEKEMPSSSQNNYKLNVSEADKGSLNRRGMRFIPKPSHGLPISGLQQGKMKRSKITENAAEECHTRRSSRLGNQTYLKQTPDRESNISSSLSSIILSGEKDGGKEIEEAEYKECHNTSRRSKGAPTPQKNSGKHGQLGEDSERRITRRSRRLSQESSDLHSENDKGITLQPSDPTKCAILLHEYYNSKLLNGRSKRYRKENKEMFDPLF